MYKHRQIGTLMIVGLGSGFLLTLRILFNTSPGPERWITILVAIVIFCCLLLFWSLNVEVKSDHILVFFGFGIIQKKIPLSQIKEVKVVTTPWYFGWGIRPAPHGWMFNVSGFGGVELIFENNERFRIGSDEPQKLLSAIQSKL